MDIFASVLRLARGIVDLCAREIWILSFEWHSRRYWGRK